MSQCRARACDYSFGAFQHSCVLRMCEFTCLYAFHSRILAHMLAAEAPRGWMRRSLPCWLLVLMRSRLHAHDYRVRRQRVSAPDSVSGRGDRPEYDKGANEIYPSVGSISVSSLADTPVRVWNRRVRRWSWKTIDKRFDRVTAGCRISPREGTTGSDSPFEGGRQAGQWSGEERGTVVSVKHEPRLTNRMHYPLVEYERACRVPALFHPSYLGLYIHTFIVSMVFIFHGVEIPPHAHTASIDSDFVIHYSSSWQPCLIRALGRCCISKLSYSSMHNPTETV